MSFQKETEQLDEEVEEIRELLYGILKGFPTGITSSFLEQQYSDRFVSRGLATPLPTNWLNVVRMAEEFEVKDMSTFTMLYLANTDYRTSSTLPNDEEGQVNQQNGEIGVNIGNRGMCRQSEKVSDEPNSADAFGIVEEENGKLSGQKSPIVSFNANNFVPIPLSSLPQTKNGELIPIKLMFALDPNAIYFRLSSWLPYCEYLYAALSRSPLPQENPKLEIGEIFAAKVDGKWERIELVRMSTNPDFWVVLLVDKGYFHIVHRNALMPITEAVKAFDKIFLAKCKLANIQTQPADSGICMDVYNRWKAETQHFVGEALRKAADNGRAELILKSGEEESWSYEEGERIPTCTAELLINGVNFGEQLVSMGLAQKK